MPRHAMIVCLGLLAFAPTDSARAVPGSTLARGQFLFSFGQSGSGPGMLDNPFDVVEGVNGRLYVADKNNNRIQVFSPLGEFLFAFGGPGAGPGQFDGPSSLAVDASHNVVVVDTFNHRIQIFDSEGGYIDSFGAEGVGNAQFSFPNGITLDVGGNYYVADTANNRIQKFGPTKQHLLSFGQFCTGAPVCPLGDFNFPHALAVDADGRILVADETGDGRVQIFTPGGNVISQFSTFVPNAAGSTSPVEVEIDSRGMVFVADLAANHIAVFRPDGQPLWSFGSTGFGAGMFRGPNGFGLTANRRIVVVDSSNDRVQVFAVPEPSSWALAISLIALGGNWDCRRRRHVAGGRGKFRATV
jgi:DNA-binding beta-propeller fold protein YncE